MSVDCMNVRAGVEVANLTDVGCQRENNEDSYLYWEPASDEEFQRKGRLAVIADGMGGHEGGQEASRMAVETVREVYDQGFHDDPQAALVESLIAAHTRIQNTRNGIPHSTAWAPLAPPSPSAAAALYFAHVGDSRLYLMRGARILRLTRDHSYVGRLVESGIVRAEDAEKHPQRHILTAALGAGREVDVDWRRPRLGVARGGRSPALHRWPVERRDRGRTGDSRERPRPYGVLRCAREACSRARRPRQHHLTSVARRTRVIALAGVETLPTTGPTAQFLSKTAMRCIPSLLSCQVALPQVAE